MNKYRSVECPAWKLPLRGKKASTEPILGLRFEGAPVLEAESYREATVRLRQDQGRQNTQHTRPHGYERPWDRHRVSQPEGTLEDACSVPSLAEEDEQSGGFT